MLFTGSVSQTLFTVVSNRTPNHRWFTRLICSKPVSDVRDTAPGSQRLSRHMILDIRTMSQPAGGWCRSRSVSHPVHRPSTVVRLLSAGAQWDAATVNTNAVVVSNLRPSVNAA